MARMEGVWQVMRGAGLERQLGFEGHGDLSLQVGRAILNGAAFKF